MSNDMLIPNLCLLYIKVDIFGHEILFSISTQTNWDLKTFFLYSPENKLILEVWDKLSVVFMTFRGRAPHILLGYC